MTDIKSISNERIFKIRSYQHVLIDSVEYLTIRRYKDCIKLHSVDSGLSNKKERLSSNTSEVNGQDAQSILSLFPNERQYSFKSSEDDFFPLGRLINLYQKYSLDQFYGITFPKFIAPSLLQNTISVEKYLCGKSKCLVNGDVWTTIELFVGNFHFNEDAEGKAFFKKTTKEGSELIEFRINDQFKEMPHLYISEPYGSRLFPEKFLIEYFGIRPNEE